MGNDDFRAALRGAQDSSTEAKIRDDLPEAVRSFVEDVDGIHGVDASARSPDDAFARVSIANDYGNRDEYGNGKVVVAPDSEDPVGRSASIHGLMIVRTNPQDGFVDYWFAPIADVGEDVYGFPVVRRLIEAAIDGEYRQAVVDVAVDVYGEDVVDAALTDAGFDPARYGADVEDRSQAAHGVGE